MPDALRQAVRSVDCELLVLSYNDESWLGVDELETLCGEGRSVATLAFDSARYVGARIGIFDPSGVKVGKVSHLSNHELLVIAGEEALVRHVVAAIGELGNEPAAAGELRNGPAAVKTGALISDRLQ
jgi:adenine-specific DNA-methyltransferase